MSARMQEDASLSEILHAQDQRWDDDDDDDIVITGISGKFPESDNVKEYWDNLINKVDMTSEDDRRYPKRVFGVPPKFGKLKDITKFDAIFFGVHSKQADSMDPQLRILLECTYEAMVDAGYDPTELSGTNTAVYVGASHSETKEAVLVTGLKQHGYGLTGCSFSMFANRISFTYNLRGPSSAVDTACSSSFTGLYQAVLAMRSNQCDAAIVGGSNVCLSAMTALQFLKLQMLSPEGVCRAFDASANGYVRGETIAVVLLQRRRKARRIYATVTNIKTNTDGAKKEGITFPSLEVQSQLLQSTYGEVNINSDDVCYIEAHGTGTKVGDPVEAQSIANCLCKNRKKPLLIGTAKPSIGHSEPSSGIGALVKVLLCIKEGIIPPTLHFSTPNPDIEPLTKGDMKIVTEITKLEGKYVGVNNFGFGGVNVHLILRRPTNKHSLEQVRKDAIPRLVLCCGRTEDGVSSLLRYLESNRVPAETYGFLHNLYKLSSTTHRGYVLLDNEQAKVSTRTKSVSSVKRPVWFVFSGMGTQWPGMGQDLLLLEPFAKSIYRSVEVLKPYGIDLMAVFSTVGDATKQKKREIVPAFVSIAAIQVALVDTLNELGITPDGIVGHSVGELGCAYADGCLTAEQMVLSAYWRGKCVEDAGLIDGAMAAVGLTWEETKNKCPEGVLPACHNAEDTVTISGPTNKMKAFVQQLNSENIFVREVDSCGYAFHCSYVNPAASALQKALETVIPNPKPRSHRWVCSSIPESDWNNPLAKHCSAAYLVNNLVSSVLFREALLHVPSDAIVIEIGPHCLLQSILKRSLSDSCVFVGLMNRREKNNLEFFLSSVGNMYNAGINPAIEKFYPEIRYPVPIDVPTISPFVKWDHTQSWKVADWDLLRSALSSSEFMVEVNISSSDCEDFFFTDHCVDGRILFPATGYLLLAWKALAKQEGKQFDQMPVEFEEISINRATLLSKAAVTKFFVSLLKISGEFEICEGGNIVSKGKVRMLTEEVVNTRGRVPKTDTNAFKLDGKDIYKELRLRGYDYGPAFQSVVEAESNGEYAKLKWNGNWVTFLDGLLQIPIVNTADRVLYLPTRILSVKIDPRILSGNTDERSIDVFCDKDTRECISEGVYLKEMRATLASRRQDQLKLPVLEEYKFVPNVEFDVLEKAFKRQVLEYLEVCATITRRYLEGNGRSKEQIFDVMNELKEAPNEIAQKYIDSEKENFILLNGIKEMMNLPSSERAHDEVKRIFKEMQLNGSKDVLSNAVLSERALRTALDVVAENLTSHNIKIVEVSSGVVISEQVQQFLTSSNIFLKIDYTVAHPKPETLEDAVKSVQWDAVTSPPSDISETDLVITKDFRSNGDFEQFLQTISSFVKDYGFILLIQRTDITPVEKILSAIGKYTVPIMSDEEIERALRSTELSLICKKYDGVASTLYLLRKTVKQNGIASRIVRMSNDNFNWVKQLKQALYDDSSEESTVWLVAEDSPTSGIIGMVNCLRKEGGGHRIRCFFNAGKNQSLPSFDLDHPAYKEIVSKDLVMNVIRNDQWGTYRHLSLRKKESVRAEHAYVTIRTVGDLSTLQFVESPLKHYKTVTNKSPGETLCSVYYTALNFKDVMIASGKLMLTSPSDFLLGMEYAGRDETGRRIFGIEPTHALATSIGVKSAFRWNVPNHWTLEEACTVPVVYSTVYYAFILRGNLQRGESVLIHSGSGGVGQAAIAVALSMDCEVFTTVGTAEKRNFLKQRFPQLKDENFCNSRDLSFENHILWATNGRGVDVVLNSLAEQKLQASLRCLKYYGRFLEIGKYDSALNNPVGMEMFLKNISFHGIHVDVLFKKECLHQKLRLVQLMQDGINSGAVRPLVRSRVYNYDQMEEAFRFMASGRHIGKLLIKIREEEKELCIPPSKVEVPAVPRVLCHPERVYIVCGGLGGFGLELADWLISGGAKRLMLTSRSGIKNGYQRLHLQQWHDRGVEVIVSNLDVCDYSQAENLIGEAKKAGVIGGIFNLAVVLRDGFLENLTEDDFEAASRPKVTATRNLDKLSRKLCPDLEWFVVFSSVSCGRGNIGQSNYGYANSVMERICEERTRDGLHGLAIQWGAIGDVGLVFESTGKNDTVIGGTLPQRMNSCLATLETLLVQNSTVVSSLVPAERNLLRKGGSERSLLENVAHIFGIKDITTLNPSITLSELGMDSLMGVEVKQTLEREHDIFLSMQEIRLLSLKKLKEIDQNNRTNIKIVKQVEPKPISTCKSLTPKECLVKMNDVTEGQPLFIISSTEGLVDKLKFIATNLCCPVYGLQSTSDVPKSSIKKIALHYCELIKPKLQSGSSCYIMGCSNFGYIVASEILGELQNGNSAKHKLFFLDDNCEDAFDGESETEELRDARRMVAFLSQFVSVSNKTQMIEYLVGLPLLKDRLQHIALVVSTATRYRSKDDVTAAAESFLRKLKCVDDYERDAKFEGRTILFTREKNEKYFGSREFLNNGTHVHVIEGDDLLQGEGGFQVASLVSKEVAECKLPSGA